MNSWNFLNTQTQLDRLVFIFHRMRFKLRRRRVLPFVVVNQSGDLCRTVLLHNLILPENPIFNEPTFIRHFVHQ